MKLWLASHQNNNGYDYNDIAEHDNHFMETEHHPISTRMAERFALPASDREVPGSNPAGGGILLMTVWRFST